MDILEEGTNPAEALMSLRDSGRKTPKKSPPIDIVSRSRKRSRPTLGSDFISDDDIVQEEEEWVSGQSPLTVKKHRSSQGNMFLTWGSSSIFTFAEKRVMKGLRESLNNLLKQSKARKWVCYEWFYSDIDRALFEGENDFSICLREHFPNLKTRNLTKAQWAIIRRLMGKPRRCSSAFFAEERQALESKRRKIRFLLQRKGTDASDYSNYKDLPDEIPLPIVIGTNITARIRSSQDGLFTGHVEAVDTFDNTYRITFDREGLETQSVPDTDVASNDRHETMPLSSLIVKERPRAAAYSGIRSPIRIAPAPPQGFVIHDPVLGVSPARLKLQEALGNEEEGGTYGGFPIKFLILVTRLSKILSIKKKCIEKLREMNLEAERKKSYKERITTDFQKRYAGLVLELENLNEDLNVCLQGVQQYCQELAPDNGLTPLDNTAGMRQQCDEEAQYMLDTSPRIHSVRNDHMKDLITDLTSLLLQIKFFAETEMKPFEVSSLNQATERIKAKLDPGNRNMFMDKVEVHIAHVQNGLGQVGNLHAFTNSASNMSFM